MFHSGMPMNGLRRPPLPVPVQAGVPVRTGNDDATKTNAGIQIILKHTAFSKPKRQPVSRSPLANIHSYSLFLWVLIAGIDKVIGVYFLLRDL